MQVISHGVPQCSIFWPALFTIYLNDIPSIPDVCSLEWYVDDSKLYLSFPVAEASNMIQQINKDLEKIASWCCYNSLLINPEKTKLLVLGTRQMLQRLPADFHVTLLGKKVTPSPSARDLGLQVDGTLSNDEHVTQTVSSCISSFKLSLIETDEKPGANVSPPKQGACYCGQRSKTRKKLFCTSGGDAKETRCPCAIGNKCCTSFCKCFNCRNRPPSWQPIFLSLWSKQ